MKIARYRAADGRERIGLVVESGIVDLTAHFPDLTDIVSLAGLPEAERARLLSLEGRSPDVALEAVELLAPVPSPRKIMGIGLNYADHAAEAGMEVPSDQLWFSKAVTTVNDPFGALRIPRVSDALDYEAELVIVIGKRCRYLPRAEAMSAIFGFCCGNDATIRDWQFKTSQFVLGKSFDSLAPIGPWIVTADSLDPGALEISLTVNGEERQRSNTKHFIFDCAAMIETLSQVMTLEPGDLVFTGTPSGVGAVMKPPKWLCEGDVVRVEIEGIGAIENRVVRDS